jgi:hypothetical protein
VETSLATKYTVIRYAGTDRYGTAAKIADEAIATFGFDGRNALLAYGRDFPDALSGGPYGGSIAAPVLLMAGLPRATSNWLRAHNDTVATLTAIGGTAVISRDDLIAAANADAPPPPQSNQTIVVTPSNTTTIPTDGQHQFTATVASGSIVSIRLFVDADLTFSRSGLVSFRDADGDNRADQTPSPAVVNAVDGATVTPAQQVDGVVSGGTVTFSITSSAPAHVIPVVWVDGGSTPGRLDLLAPPGANANPKQPSESFGIGGITYFAPADAVAGSYPGLSATGVNTAADYFVATGGSPDPGSYHYDVGDTFRDGGSSVTMAQFESILAVGDTVAVTYAPGGASLFDVIARAG